MSSSLRSGHWSNLQRSEASIIDTCTCCQSLRCDATFARPMFQTWSGSTVPVIFETTCGATPMNLRDWYRCCDERYEMPRKKTGWREVPENEVCEIPRELK